MSRYLTKYVGTYRVIAEYDKSTNDFPRLENGIIDPSFEDLYIPCRSGIKILHHSGNILICYVPAGKKSDGYKSSLGTGYKILRQIYNDKINEHIPSNEEVIKQLIEQKIIIDILILDFEMEFKFRANLMEYMATILQPKTYGASISPFSTKNLPKARYIIPQEDLDKYKNIIQQFNIPQIKQINKLFEPQIVKKIGKNWKAQQKKQMLRFKEFVHTIGLWDQYILFLRTITNDK